MRRLLLVCATLFLSRYATQAQTNTQPTFKVTGSVVNAATGEPIRNAMVDFNNQTPKSAMTGPDGHFEIDGITAGTHFVTARHPGFSPANNAQTVTVGSSTDSIVIKLSPLSRISGRITDREGEPIDGIAVTTQFQMIIGGHKRWQPSGGATTDETGHFFIEDLGPGSYILQTAATQLYRPLQQNSEAARYLYPPTFYPNSPTRDSAQRIELAPGQDMTIDMELHSVRGVQVTLTTEPRTSNVTAFLTTGQDNRAGRPAQPDGKGVFTFPAVAPGSWTISVRGGRGNNSQESVYGELPVDVGNTDIDNLVIPIGRLADIPVLVSGLPNPQVFVQLTSASGPAYASSYDQSGEMKVHSVPPGTYRVFAGRINNNTCVTSMQSGSQDLMRDQLVVPLGGTPPPIQVVLSDKCPQLSVTVKDRATIIITSSQPGVEPMQIYSSGNTAATATLSPGEYQVFAFDDVTNLEYANPEAMRDFKGQAVTLEAGQNASVQLEVNQRHPQ